MEFLFISGILFIASQVIPSQPETEEQKRRRRKKPKSKTVVKIRYMAFLSASIKMKVTRKFRSG